MWNYASNIRIFALVFALVACRPERAPVEDLYTARMLGLSYLQRNQLPEAEAEFKKITTLAPDDPSGYADLGLTYLQAARYDDAEKQLKRARELDPSSPDVALALARVYALTKRPNDARELLDKLRRDSTSNARALYALAELEAQQPDPASAARYRDRLGDVLVVAPANLAARLRLVDLFVKRRQADSAVQQLEEVRRIPPELPKEARVYLDSAIQLLRFGGTQAARPTIDHFLQVTETTPQYQASLDAVRWTEGPIPGRPVLTFAPKYFVSLRGVRQKAATGLAKFVDATDEAGLPRADATAAGGGTVTAPRAATLATGDVDGDGVDDIFVSAWSVSQNKATVRLYRVQSGFVRDASPTSGIALASGATFATFADYDNDGWLDLFAIDGAGKPHLFRNRGNGTFEETTAASRIGAVPNARKALFVDLDHDGDLDILFVGGDQAVVYRNNLDGSFTESTAAFGISAPGATDAAFADLDGDGRIDIVIASEKGSSAILHNGGAQRFTDVTATTGLPAGTASGTVVAEDYNNDGFIDLFFGGVIGTSASLWLNKGNGTFTRDTRSQSLAQALRNAKIASATFADYDNDGWLDLVVGAVPSGAKQPAFFVFRNDSGKFTESPSVIPAAIKTAGASAIAVSDIDDDGDEDLWILDGAGSPHLLRNDLGNSNLAVNVQLKGLRNGSGKNNAFGVGARLELRAGDIYQTRVATGRTTHFGLGSHLKADVLRVEWPNGVPQTIYFPGSDQDVVEREMLKGSCALAYTWDGKKFRFVTDAMWRSALGMPLGLMRGNSAFAPAGASQEYLRIPGDALQPRNGRYWLQLTEELWETAYADEVRLVAVDHPDSVDVFVDERFVPPGAVKLRLFQTARRIQPLSATD
ncbi:MAG TPA: FG-GAP-like repeat-containing protein, partial [Gemmatimonadaceae bacterium]